MVYLSFNINCIWGGGLVYVCLNIASIHHEDIKKWKFATLDYRCIRVPYKANSLEDKMKVCMPPLNLS